MRSELRRACVSIRLRLSIRLSIGLSIGLSIVGTTPKAQADEVSTEFKRGVDAYRAGQTADAIHIWEAVYGQAGEKRGYRVAFNLGRAYEAQGDSTHAAEFYEAFLAQMDTLHAGKAAIDANVLKEEKEARREIAELQAKNGRLHVPAADRSLTVKVDAAPPRVAGFTMYVSAGMHTVVFDAGAPNESLRSIDVKAGEIAEVPPPAEPAPIVAPASTEDAAPVVAVSPLPRVRRVEHPSETVHPFSPVVLVVAAGVTAVSIVIPILTYSHATSVYDAATPSDLATTKYRDKYDSDRTTAYATLSIPIALAAVTGALTGWYFLGSKEKPAEDDLVPVATRVPGGAVFGATGRF